jgi:hypothetical protein
VLIIKNFFYIICICILIIIINMIYINLTDISKYVPTYNILLIMLSLFFVYLCIDTSFLYFFCKIYASVYN